MGRGPSTIMDQQTGKYVIVSGIFILVVGILIYFFSGHLKWLGRLPGDVHIEKGNFRFYFPVVSMLLLSILVTVIVNIVKRVL